MGKQNRTFISPYNDGQVIAGQGTVAMEILQQLSVDLGGLAGTGTPSRALPEIANWVVPTGGRRIDLRLRRGDQPAAVETSAHWRPAEAHPLHTTSITGTLNKELQTTRRLPMA